MSSREAVDPALSAAVDAMAGLVDLRDGYAGGHVGRVVTLALMAGRWLGFDDDELADLSLTARLRDVGKVGLPDAVLHKPGALNDAEWAIVRQHSVLGAQVLAGIPGLAGVARAVRHHHERWDGQGYPDGLAGEEIPRASRVVAVCEAYAALTSDRPYRPAYDAGTALKVLESGAGTQFEARAVAAVRARAPELADAGEAAPATRSPRRVAAPHPAKPDILAAFERLETLPTIAGARERLAGVLARDSARPADLIRVIESDVALVIAVLRAANVGRPRGAATGSVPRAIEQLSPEGVRVLAERLSEVGMFERLPGWHITLEHFRLHAVATQRAAQRVARILQITDVDELAVAALLHDVGQLVLSQAYADYPEGVHGGARTPEERIRAERVERGVDHAAAGGVLARRWGLPDRIATAIERHHDPTASGDAGIVRVADMLAHHAHGQPIDPRQLSAAATRLGIDAPALRELTYELTDPGDAAPRAVTPSPLSPQQTAVLRGLAGGHVYKQIAQDLGLSVSTVRSHCHAIYTKLGVNDRAQAVLTATGQGWI